MFFKSSMACDGTPTLWVPEWLSLSNLALQMCCVYASVISAPYFTILLFPTLHYYFFEIGAGGKRYGSAPLQLLAGPSQAQLHDFANTSD